MFFIACEVTEEKRVEVLDPIGKMQSERRIRNVATMISIIEACWKRSDFGDWNGDWRGMIRLHPGGRLPSFI